MQFLVQTAHSKTRIFWVLNTVVTITRFHYPVVLTRKIMFSCILLRGNHVRLFSFNLKFIYTRVFFQKAQIAETILGK